MITLSQARRVLNNRAPSHRVKYRNGYFYTSRLGYVCFKPSPNNIGHAICTVEQFNNPDPVYTAARVVIETAHDHGVPTIAALYDLEQALNNADS